MTSIGLTTIAVVNSEETRLEHHCRMGLLAVAILHWIVFYLLTQSVAPPTSESGNFTRARRLNAHHAIHAVDTRSPAS